MLCIFFFIPALKITAQPSPYSQTFDSVYKYILSNYAGAKDKITSLTQKDFNKLTGRCRQIAAAAKNDAYCLYAIHTWLGFFKDHHIALSPMDNASPGRLQAAIASTEHIRVDSGTVRQFREQVKTDGGIEGIYSNPSYEMVVVKNSNGLRSYAGIITRSAVPEWTPGQVKAELIPTGKHEYDIIWYYKDHHPVFDHGNFEKDNAFLLAGWTKKGYTKPPYVYKPIFEEEKTETIFFKSLDSTTNYLRIADFDIGLYRKIDSIVTANFESLIKKPKLIIDLRWNGGGGDRSYRSLRPLLYTQPVKIVGLDLWVTPDNIAANERLFAENPNIPRDYIEQYRTMVKTAPDPRGSFVNVFPDRMDTLQSYNYPSKIAVIINNKCGSTTEQFLLEAVQSKKVQLLGEHSAGVLDYANMRDMNYQHPAFTLSYATTRSRRIDIGQGIDNKGIQPGIVIDFNQDGWFELIRAKLNAQ